jgi:hypothetical protein
MASASGDVLTQNQVDRRAVNMEECGQIGKSMKGPAPNGENRFDESPRRKKEVTYRR